MFYNFSGKEKTVSRGALCKNFKKKLYFGTVAALLLTAEVRKRYKVVYEDGNCEDMTLAQLVTAQKRYKRIGKGTHQSCQSTDLCGRMAITAASKDPRGASDSTGLLGKCDLPGQGPKGCGRQREVE